MKYFVELVPDIILTPDIKCTIMLSEGFIVLEKPDDVEKGQNSSSDEEKDDEGSSSSSKDSNMSSSSSTDEDSSNFKTKKQKLKTKCDSLKVKNEELTEKYEVLKITMLHAMRLCYLYIFFYISQPWFLLL